MIEDPLGRHWDEANSQRYLDYGRYFVPQRETQMRMTADLVSSLEKPGLILELCCGDGLLAELLLYNLPDWTYLGLDGSSLMLERAGERLSRYADRVHLERFELAESSWRVLARPARAVVSSMAIHHLDGEGKRQLFKAVYHMLEDGGIFVISDMVEPASGAGMSVAADAWDEVVRQRSLELDGKPDGYEFFQREGWNTYRDQDPDDIDHPSPLLHQLNWLEEAGFSQVDVHFFQAGHALFSGWKINANDKGSV
jgi:SAM-dependent methyltransferase